MTERDFWSRRVRPVLHRPDLRSLAWKVQDAFNKGLPDVMYNIQGRVGLIEMKYVKAYPKRASTPIAIKVTKEQRRFLGQWAKCGGSAYVLLGVLDDFYLFAWNVPERLPSAKLLEHAITHGATADLHRLRTSLSLRRAG